VVSTGDGRAVAELHDLVAPRADELRAAVARLQALRDHARARGGETVLCHTDIWGSNFILSSDGTLHLVDWNGALIGPPEADLFMFAGTGFFPAERFDWFLERYEAAFRPIQPDPGVLGFYFYRRNLEDLADFVDAVATGRTDAMALDDSLDLIGELLAEQARLEDRIAVLPRRIKHPPRP
jgi:spectinomycin phosphotransferase